MNFVNPMIRMQTTQQLTMREAIRQPQNEERRLKAEAGPQTVPHVAKNEFHNHFESSGVHF
jgi:hypothetical protein